MRFWHTKQHHIRDVEREVPELLGVPEAERVDVYSACAKHVDRWWHEWVVRLPFFLMCAVLTDIVPGLRGLGPGTRLKIATVTAIILAVIYLWYYRWRQHRIQETLREHLWDMRCHDCEYCLAGTLATDGDTCPECGWTITQDIRRRWEFLKLRYKYNRKRPRDDSSMRTRQRDESLPRD